jgi:hypothetical protein
MYQNISLITKSKTNLSLSCNDRIYVVGFPEKRHAKYVKHVLSTFPRLEMRRTRVDNVKDEINKGLIEMGHTPFHESDVTIDVDAHIMINKRDDIECDSDYAVEEIEFGDFLMYPFEKYLGIVMPYEIAHEDTKHVYFKAQVVDPSVDFKIFSKTLKF